MLGFGDKFHVKAMVGWASECETLGLVNIVHTLNPSGSIFIKWIYRERGTNKL